MNLFGIRKKHLLPSADSALPGRIEEMIVPASHFVNGNPMQGPFPDHLQQAVFGMGCFWGVERVFWQLPGVYTTAAGYAAGVTPNPSYQVVQDRQKAVVAELGAKRAQLATQFMEANAARDEVTTTESGLQYEVLESGNGGASPNAQSTVVTHYHGTFVDGTVFDSSVERGEPAEFGVNQVIPGWTEALQLMTVGDKWRIACPPTLAYGEQGAGDSIPPNTALVFEIHLVNIKD